MLLKQATILATAIVVTSFVASSVQHKLKTRKIIREIEAQTARDIARIKTATDIVVARVNNGVYDDTGLPALYNDFEFYQIVIDN